MNNEELRAFLRGLAGENDLTDAYLEGRFNTEMVDRYDTIYYTGGSLLSQQGLFDASVQKSNVLRNYKISDNKRELFAVLSMYVTHNFLSDSATAGLLPFEQNRLETYSFIHRFNGQTQVMEIPLYWLVGNRMVNNVGVMTNFGKDQGFFDLKVPFFMPRETNSPMRFDPVPNWTLKADGATTAPPLFGTNPTIADNRSYYMTVHCIGYAITDPRKNITT